MDIWRDVYSGIWALVVLLSCSECAVTGSKLCNCLTITILHQTFGGQSSAQSCWLISLTSGTDGRLLQLVSRTQWAPPGIGPLHSKSSRTSYLCVCDALILPRTYKQHIYLPIYVSRHTYALYGLAQPPLWVFKTGKWQCGQTISDQTKIFVLFLGISEMSSELLGYTWKLKLAIF